MTQRWWFLEKSKCNMSFSIMAYCNLFIIKNVKGKEQISMLTSSPASTKLKTREMRKTEGLALLQERITLTTQPQLIWWIKLTDGLPCGKHTLTAWRLHVIHRKCVINMQRWKLTQNQGQSDFYRICQSLRARQESETYIL